ncbi:MAG: IS3 family transposase, partial [Marinobacter sp.]|uniref:IS3 family transposase n=1 Tax=Marinobacter sp. TaxID=50741 RepID=UPI003297D7EC
MIERGHPQVSLVRQCKLLKLSRSSVYYVPREQCQEDLDLMYLIDQQHLETPYYGSRKMRVHLERQGHRINRKRVQRLMRTMGIQAVYPRPRTSIPGDGHKVYPYLLKGLKIDRPNQVLATDRVHLTVRYYPKGQNGRPPYPLSAMLRVHCMQLFYNLSDPAMEDALYEIESMRH